MDQLPTPYQQYIHLSRYSRYKDDLERRETWPETVERLIQFWRNELQVDEDTLTDIRDAIIHLDVMPSMRSLMTAGPALERDHVAGYNCAYLPIEHPRCFDELMYVLLCGTGVGFSVERQYVNKLPEVAEEFHETDSTIVVADSKIGWASSFRELISLLYGGKVPKWDVSRIRPAGARLKTFGGRASGPEPLVDLFQFTIRVFKGAAGRKLTSLECHDIVCKVAEVVVVGGVRRSALISLSNLSDDRMRNAKSGQWWIDNPQRALANNSYTATEKPDFTVFLEEWSSLYESKSGERGVFSRSASQRKAAENGRRDSEASFGTNPCSEIILRPYEFCNLSEVIVRPDDTLADLKRKVKIATILGTMQSTLSDFRYLRKKWKNNCEEERLLGVSLTGICDHPELSDSLSGGFDILSNSPHTVMLEDALQELRDVAIETNKEWADRLGINQSTAITCVKPSGTVSQLVNSSSGIHPRFSPYYIRRVRNDKKDPLSQFMIDRGFPYEEDKHNAQAYVFSFPMKAPEGSVINMEAKEQLELWDVYNKNWCVSGDTKVLTDQGQRNIEDIVGCNVQVWNGKEFSEVVPFETGVQNIFRVSFDDGSYIDMTNNHKLLTSEGKKELGECSIGESIYNQNDLPIVVGNWIDPKTDAYSQGFYSGDGYSLGNWTLVYPPKYSCITRLVGRVRIEETSGRGRYWKHKEAGVVDKDYVPTKTTHEYKLNWLAGLIDSDGNKNGKGFQISSVDRRFLLNIKIMLTTLGVKCRIQEKPASQFGIRPCFYLNVSGKYTNKLLSMGLKTERVELIGSKRNTKDRNLSIVSIEPLGKDITYCFTENKLGQGVFNGILTGQCEHKPSMTCYYTDDEFLEIGNWLWNHFDEVSGVSFLPKVDHVYEQAPYEEITEEKFMELLSEMPDEVDWTELGDYEHGEDNTKGSQELACSASGGCEI